MSEPAEVGDAEPIVSVVTGAGTGIGRAIALRLARRGRVALVGRRREPLEAVASELGDDALVVAADISTGSGVDTIARAVEKRWGRVDVIVNNAGQFLPVSTDMSASEIEANLNQLFATNVRGPFLLVAALSRMLRRPGGRIINISSLSTRTGGTRPVDMGSGPVPGHHAGYVATKGGLESLTIGLAAELAPQGITVNAVAPGYVEATEMTGSFSKERIATMLRQIPVGRPGRAEEIAATVAFLASPEAGYITGEIVMANGGWVFGG